MKVELTKEWCMNMAKIEERAGDAATMCVWCEERVTGACKSHYETLTCERRVIVPTAEEWAGAEAHALKYALYRLADAAEALGVNHFGDDWRSDQVQELQAATRAARLVLGPNAEVRR